MGSSKSRKLAAVVVAIIIIAALVALAAQQFFVQKPEEVEINVGVLVDLSGPLTTFGEDIRDALLIGTEEMNAYFTERGEPYRVKLFVEDTKVDPKVALEKVQSLHGKGVTLIVGPMGSGELKQVAEYVTANKMIIISPSSTAPIQLLGITRPEEKKYIFRFVTTDIFQTEAIAKEAAELGIKGLVIAYLGNAWGKGLNDFGKPKFIAQGIEVKESIEYPDPPPADFTPYIAMIENSVNELLQRYDKSQVAVVAFSYEEVYTMLSQVKAESVLLEVKWLGCDGTAKSRKITEIPEKVNKVGMYSTLFDSRGPSFAKLNEAYRERYGKEMYQYALDAYDAEWVIALSFAEVYNKLGKYDPDEMANVIPTVTEKYSKGEYAVTTVSGYIKLDEYNDRASGDYAIWAVENSEWVLKGTWMYTENRIEWE
ncbi:MAG: ABC transporter substrate-binding protein [Candidatus Bathyarchaeia archaeon]